MNEHKMIEKDGVLNVIDLGVEKSPGEGYAKMKDKDVPTKGENFPNNKES